MHSLFRAPLLAEYSSNKLPIIAGFTGATAGQQTTCFHFSHELCLADAREANGPVSPAGSLAQDPDAEPLVFLGGWNEESSGAGLAPVDFCFWHRDTVEDHVEGKSKGPGEVIPAAEADRTTLLLRKLSAALNLQKNFWRDIGDKRYILA